MKKKNLKMRKTGKKINQKTKKVVMMMMMKKNQRKMMKRSMKRYNVFLFTQSQIPLIEFCVDCQPKKCP